MNTQANEILRYLEESYTGAKACEDEETMLRISRAIIAFSAAVDCDIFRPEIIDQAVSDVHN